MRLVSCQELARPGDGRALRKERWGGASEAEGCQRSPASQEPGRREDHPLLVRGHEACPPLDFGVPALRSEDSTSIHMLFTNVAQVSQDSPADPNHNGCGGTHMPWVPGTSSYLEPADAFLCVPKFLLMTQIPDIEVRQKAWPKSDTARIFRDWPTWSHNILPHGWLSRPHLLGST